MPDLLVTSTLHMKSGIPADDVVNNFAVSMPAGVGATEYDALCDEVFQFFHGNPTGHLNPLMQLMSQEFKFGANGQTIRVYDITGKLDGSPHGSPIHESVRNTTIAGLPTSSSLPRECAVVMTLRGTGWADQPIERPDGADAGTEVDRPRQRYSGRLYLGPWGQIACEDAASGYGRPTSLVRGRMIAAAEDFAAGVRAITPGAVWCIWSRKSQFLHTVDEVQVDDAFDTQRRRGNAATLRQSAIVSS